MSARKAQYEVVNLVDLERESFRKERANLKRRGTVVGIWRQRKGVKIPWVECLDPVARIGDAKWVRWMEYMMRDDDGEAAVST